MYRVMYIAAFRIPVPHLHVFGWQRTRFMVWTRKK